MDEKEKKPNPQPEESKLLDLPSAHLIQKIAYNEKEKQEDIKRLRNTTIIIISSISLITIIFILGSIDIDNIKDPLLEILKLVALVFVGNFAIFKLGSMTGKFQKDIYNAPLHEEKEYTDAFIKKEGIVEDFVKYKKNYYLEQTKLDAKLQEAEKEDYTNVTKNDGNQKNRQSTKKTSTRKKTQSKTTNR